MTEFLMDAINVEREELRKQYMSVLEHLKVAVEHAFDHALCGVLSFTPLERDVAKLCTLKINYEKTRSAQEALCGFFTYKEQGDLNQ